MDGTSVMTRRFAGAINVYLTDSVYFIHWSNRETTKINVIDGQHESSVSIYEHICYNFW